MSNVVHVSLGSPNRQEANAPEGSGVQYNIILHMSDGSELKSGSGWWWWMEKDPEGTRWYHLGGIRGKRKPTIYKLRDEPSSSSGWWIKNIDQSRADEIYEKHGLRLIMQLEKKINPT